MNTVFKNAHVSNTTCVNFSPNKPNIIISGDMEGIIKIWNMENHKCLQLLDGHKGSNR